MSDSAEKRSPCAEYARLDEHYFADVISEWYSANYAVGVRLRVQEREHLARFLAHRTQARAPQFDGYPATD